LAGLYVIVGDMEPDEQERLVEESLVAGADMVQLRCKSVSYSDIVRRARNLRFLAAAKGKPLIVNDNLEAAVEAGADGVHLGPNDMSIKTARLAAAGRPLIIGASVGAVDTARVAEADGADYLGVGPVYPTSSKSDTRPVIGLARLKEICEAVKIPVFAIGGINMDRLPGVLAAGAAGAAVISAVSAAESPGQIVTAMKTIIEGKGRYDDTY
jgi:thiamine-phosphate pyrophosphorylase